MKTIHCQLLCSAGGGTRTHTRLPSPDFLSPLRSQTRADTEGQEETKLRFYRGSGASEVTGRDREGHPVAVRIAVKICTRKRNFPGGIERVPEREGPAYAVPYAFTSPSSLVDCKIVTLLQGLMPTLLLGGGLPPRVSKLVNVAEYRHFDFGMSFGTDC